MFIFSGQWKQEWGIEFPGKKESGAFKDSDWTTWGVQVLDGSWDRRHTLDPDHEGPNSPHKEYGLFPRAQREHLKGFKSSELHGFFFSFVLLWYSGWTEGGITRVKKARSQSLGEQWWNPEPRQWEWGCIHSSNKYYSLSIVHWELVLILGNTCEWVGKYRHLHRAWNSVGDEWHR